MIRHIWQINTTQENHMQVVATESQRRIRQNDLERLEELEAKEREQARKNSNFTQTTPAGWKRMRKC